MIYLTHGYIDILNHELRNSNGNNLKLVTKSSDIIFQNNEEYNYNSKEFVNKVLEKIIHDLVDVKQQYESIQIKKSILKLAAKGKNLDGNTSHEHELEIKLRPSEDTAHIFIGELSIVTAFKNELSCTKRGYIIRRNVILHENCSRLLTIPEHGIQISLNHCSSYDKFKSIMLRALYEDISRSFINELKKLNLPKWNINLNQTSLDVENIVNENMKILIA